MYFSRKGSLPAEPFANLDVDDTDSFGPRTITRQGRSTATVGSLIRPVGGAMADRWGGARVTFVNFLGMGVAAAIVLLAAVGGIIMVLVASTVLPHVPAERRGMASGAIFLGVGVGIAASQWQRPLVLQSASFAGAWSVSFLLVLFNLDLNAITYFMRGAVFVLPPRSGGHVRIRIFTPTSRSRFASIHRAQSRAFAKRSETSRPASSRICSAAAAVLPIRRRWAPPGATTSAPGRDRRGPRRAHAPRRTSCGKVRPNAR